MVIFKLFKNGKDVSLQRLSELISSRPVPFLNLKKTDTLENQIIEIIFDYCSRPDLIINT